MILHFILTASIQPRSQGLSSYRPLELARSLALVKIENRSHKRSHKLESEESERFISSYPVLLCFVELNQTMYYNAMQTQDP